MKKLILTGLLAIFAMSTGVSQTEEQVSAEISAWLAEYFSNESIMDMHVDFNDQNDAYEVKMSDGSEIEFDVEGHPTSIKSRKGFWPEALPEEIANYLNTNHKDVKVVKYKKEDNGYEVKLANGTELEFDINGQLRDN
ncbi:MAG TPA: PepSY-like domain-containing protein [Salegentibacter sp.]|uniref:PepSY-like domain-containing protein n=1 Tax=Salegentibacter sp. TaxID=1903072 RepID=UPI002F95AFD6